MNRKTKQNIHNICICTGILLAFLILLNFDQIITKMTTIIENRYVVITNNIIYVPQDCIKKYYLKTVDNEGLMLLLDPCPEDCGEKYIHESNRVIYGDESQEEMNQMTIDLYQKVKSLGGNATIFKSAIIYNSETDEFIEDMTEEIRESMKKEALTPKLKV